MPLGLELCPGARGLSHGCIADDNDTLPPTQDSINSQQPTPHSWVKGKVPGAPLSSKTNDMTSLTQTEHKWPWLLWIHGCNGHTMPRGRQFAVSPWVMVLMPCSLNVLMSCLGLAPQLSFTLHVFIDTIGCSYSISMLVCFSVSFWICLKISFGLLIKHFLIALGSLLSILSLWGLLLTSYVYAEMLRSNFI